MWTEALPGIVFVPAQKLSNIVWTQPKSLRNPFPALQSIKTLRRKTTIYISTIFSLFVCCFASHKNDITKTNPGTRSKLACKAASKLSRLLDWGWQHSTLICKSSTLLRLLISQRPIKSFDQVKNYSRSGLNKWAWTKYYKKETFKLFNL